jgi:hypothetical protein
VISEFQPLTRTIKVISLITVFANRSLLSREHSIRGHHRDRAAALNQTCVRGQIIYSQKALYRDTRKTQKTLQQDGKNRAMLRSFRPHSIVFSTRTLPSGLQSLSNAYTLYCRAVIVNCIKLPTTTKH